MNNNGLRGARGRKRRGGIQRGMSRKNDDRAAYRGIVSRPSYIPPRVLYTPWNSLVLSWEVAGATAATNKCLTIANDLVPAFRIQAGIPAAVEFGMRIVSMQAWHLIPNGELNNLVRVRFFSLIEGITACALTDTLAQVEDQGTIVRNASAKFVWPKTHSSNTFPSTSTRVFARLTLGAGQHVLVHLHLLWKFYGTSTSLFNQEILNEGVSNLSITDFPLELIGG
jgi:hypothetical protein